MLNQIASLKKMSSLPKAKYLYWALFHELTRYLHRLRYQYPSCNSQLRDSVDQLQIINHLINRIFYRRCCSEYLKQCSLPGSNWRPSDYETDALPTEPKERQLDTETLSRLQRSSNICFTAQFFSNPDQIVTYLPSCCST